MSDYETTGQRLWREAGETDFDNWWYRYGSSLRPLETEDSEEHARRVAKESWDESRKEIERLRQLNEDKHKHLEAYRKAASDDKAEIERLRQELDEARAAARRLLTVLANGDASVVQRGIEEYPWLEDTNE